MRGLDWSLLINMALSVIPALVCITVHELSHGFAAYAMGDDTAERAGRLTLNPVKHIDIFGLLMMIMFKIGWAKPVPVDMRRFKNPKRGMAVTALAGPLSNIVFACIILIVYGLTRIPLTARGSGTASAVSEMIYNTAYISVALAVFNIIPIPPLDGSKILFSVIPDSAYFKLMRYERFGMIILIILVMTGAPGGRLPTAVGSVFDRFFNLFAIPAFEFYRDVVWR